MTLQDLAEALINEIPGTRISDKNTHNKANTEEKDLWISHVQYISELPFADPMVPVECKNEATPASSEEVTRFETKIRDSGGSDGILIAREGLAGSPQRSAHQAIEKALSHRIRIVVITGADLAQLTCPADLVTLIQDRMSEPACDRLMSPSSERGLLRVAPSPSTSGPCRDEPDGPAMQRSDRSGCVADDRPTRTGTGCATGIRICPDR